MTSMTSRRNSGSRSAKLLIVRLFSSAFRSCPATKESIRSNSRKAWRRSVEANIKAAQSISGSRSFIQEVNCSFSPNALMAGGIRVLPVRLWLSTGLLEEFFLGFLRLDVGITLLSGGYLCQERNALHLLVVCPLLWSTFTAFAAYPIAGPQSCHVGPG